MKMSCLLKTTLSKQSEGFFWWLVCDVTMPKQTEGSSSLNLLSF